MNSKHTLELGEKLVGEIEAIIKKLGGLPEETFTALAFALSYFLASQLASSREAKNNPQSLPTYIDEIAKNLRGLTEGMLKLRQSGNVSDVSSKIH